MCPPHKPRLPCNVKSNALLWSSLAHTRSVHCVAFRYPHQTKMSRGLTHRQKGSIVGAPQAPCSSHLACRYRAPYVCPPHHGAATLLGRLVATQATRRGGGADVSPTLPPPPPGPKLQHANADMDDLVEVGIITSAHGIKGEVKVQASTDEPKQRFGRAGNRLYLQPPRARGLLVGMPAQGKATSLFQVTTKGARVRPLGKEQEAWLVAFEEINSRTEAEALQGCTIFVPLAERSAVKDPDEFYVQDIIGCAVLEQATGRTVGTVQDMFSGTGTYDTLVVALRQDEADIAASVTRTCLIPFVKAICPVLDSKSRQLLVAPPEGLLDMYSRKPMRKPLSPEAKAQRLRELQQERQEEEARVRAWQPPAPPSPPTTTATSAPPAAGPRTSQQSSSRQKNLQQQQQQATGRRKPDSDSEDLDNDEGVDDDAGQDDGVAGADGADDDGDAAPGRRVRPGGARRIRLRRRPA